MAEKQLSGIYIRISSLVVFVFFVLVALVLAYVGGVMSGRVVVEKDAKKNNIKSPIERNLNQNATQENSVFKNILAPEDLHFARDLRDKNVVTPKVDPILDPVTIKQTNENFVGPRLPQTPPTITTESQSLTDYIFQMAAFKDEAVADNLREKLEGKGLRTRMRKDGSLYIVFVLLRGNESRAEEINVIAEELRLGKPVIVNKIAVKN